MKTIRIGCFLIALATLPFAAGGCGKSGAEIPPPPPASKNSAGPAKYDPAAATVRISGNVVFKGAPMDPPPLTVGDKYCRGKARELWEEQRLTTKSGELRNAIIYLKSGYEQRDYGTPAEPVVLDQQECVYTPHVLTVMKGQNLRILNSDATFHNVHARGDKGDAFNLAQPQKGSEDFKSFGHTGMFRVGCDFHSWMSAYAGVFDHPFHTTSKDGKFELRVPPGKYEVVAWHEKYGEQSATIDATTKAALQLTFEFAK